MLKIIDEDGRVKFILGDDDTEPQPIEKVIKDKKGQDEDAATDNESTDEN